MLLIKTSCCFLIFFSGVLFDFPPEVPFCFARRYLTTIQMSVFFYIGFFSAMYSTSGLLEVTDCFTTLFFILLLLALSLYYQRAGLYSRRNGQ